MTPTTEARIASLRSQGARLNPRTALAVAAFLAGVTHLLYHASYTVDDAYISFRYARNLVRGLGLVWNPGEYVKGYSNTLYTFLMAVPEAFGRDPIVFSKLLGALSFVTVCALGFRSYAAEQEETARDRGVWFVAFCAGSAPLAVHAMTGLETGTYTALVLAAVLARSHEQRSGGRPWSALLFAAVALSRPEGIALFLAMAAHDVVVRLLDRKVSARDALFYALPLVVYLAELGLSQLYYGDPLPQTYRAKTRPSADLAATVARLWQEIASQTHASSYTSRGLDLVLGSRYALLLLPLALVPRPRRRLAAAAALVVLAQLVFVAHAHTDWMPGFRFGAPVLPLVFVLVLESIAAVTLLAPSRRRLAGSLLAAGVFALVLPRNLSEAQTIQAKRYVDAQDKLVEGAALAKLSPPGVTLATLDIGGNGYGAGGFDVLDTAGLTSRALTHCYRHRQEGCRRFVALVRPEILRRHPSDRDSAFAFYPARTSGLYLELDGGRYAILEALVLLPRLPEHAVPLVSPIARGLVLAGTDLPPVVRRGVETSVTLFWQRAGTAALPTREIEWDADGAQQDAQGTRPLWSRLTAPERWTPERFFADRVVLHAPTAPGRHELWVRLDGDRVRIGTVEVTSDAEAPARARGLVADARALARVRRPLAAIHRLERAVQLDGSAAIRNAYASLIIERARRLQSDARGMLEREPTRALAVLAEARALLHRAAWESGRASSALRAEIDAEALLHRTLIDAELERARKDHKAKRARERRERKPRASSRP